jgi:hypothetical protein
MPKSKDLDDRCERLRSLHVPGEPLLLPNAWDVASARAVEAAGFPVVATTSGGVAAALAYEDHEGARGEEMLAAAARISRGVSVPVTVDAEAGYQMEPADLVAACARSGPPADRDFDCTGVGSEAGQYFSGSRKVRVKATVGESGDTIFVDHCESTGEGHGVGNPCTGIG